jgi:hypothetical protein
LLWHLLYLGEVSAETEYHDSLPFPQVGPKMMSSPVSEAPADPAAVPPPTPTAAQVLVFVKDNFVLVSAGAVLLGVTLSTTFLAAYLSVFDWHLLWFVQYTDTITFGLLALGIVSGSITLLQSAVQTILGGKTPEQRRAGIILLVVLWIVGAALNIWASVHSGQGYLHIISGVIVFCAAVALIVIIAVYIETRTLPNAVQCMWVLLLLIVCAGALGRWLGYSVEETSAFNQDVRFKDQTLNDAKLVIVMSRHTVLLKDRILYVVPTGDIAKFQTSHELITIPPAPTVSK